MNPLVEAYRPNNIVEISWGVAKIQVLINNPKCSCYHKLVFLSYILFFCISRCSAIEKSSEVSISTEFSLGIMYAKELQS